MQRIRQSVRVEQAMHPSWGSSALPLTMELVDVLQIDIVKEDIPSDWHAHDKVVAFLDPLQTDHVRRFYENSGPCIGNLLGPRQLQKYDKYLLALLLSWLQENHWDVYQEVLLSLP